MRQGPFGPAARGVSVVGLTAPGLLPRKPPDHGFFNYSTMQMTAKIVYYGPGLCGKTTNLQYIYDHTTPDSRGEMVSLETQTDRTLFFDLLPLEVGTIAGFRTRIQLYTVPGQVFYNTTRKLVLKGVDGIVFVADSQRSMLETNLESLRNLEDNLAELGILVDTIPVVLQFNKRDLTSIFSVEELNEILNRASGRTRRRRRSTASGSSRPCGRSPRWPSSRSRSSSRRRGSASGPCRPARPLRANRPWRGGQSRSRPATPGPRPPRATAATS